jgi:hypothetical protein
MLRGGEQCAPEGDRQRFPSWLHDPIDRSERTIDARTTEKGRRWVGIVGR